MKEIHIITHSSSVLVNHCVRFYNRYTLFSSIDESHFLRVFFNRPQRFSNSFPLLFTHAGVRSTAALFPSYFPLRVSCTNRCQTLPFAKTCNPQLISLFDVIYVLSIFFRFPMCIRTVEILAPRYFSIKYIAAQ